MGFPWGLDFGNQNCVVAIARKGGIDVIDNEASSRKVSCHFVSDPPCNGSSQQPEGESSVMLLIPAGSRLLVGTYRIKSRLDSGRGASINALC